MKGRVFSWIVVAGAIIFSMLMIGDLLSLLNSINFAMG